ncbi:carboxypeptidase Q-like [Tribolium madens]|uniref:carboxypeptidase Q-like n=1 Tax=Tribolium madens TaxID=41895 RepID=UPI001CF72571|nr:carboxypeptidase Q-like [Tribolium madens]
MLLRQSIATLVVVAGVLCDIVDNKVEDCNLPQDLVNEIASYAPIVQKIINTSVNGSFKGITYNELAYFVDKFGNRISGSQNLEDAIDFMIKKSSASGLDNVHGEEVPVPHWIRGSESATLVAPRSKNLTILGLGNSIGTPPEGILAEVLVVKSFDELNAKAEKAKGKIVVFNQDYISYGQSVAYRGQGATAAAKAGGVASLIRSITPFSLNTPHTGMQSYKDNVTKIPTACITVEDAHLLQRLQNEGYTIKILLKMEAQTLPDVTSRNVVAEIEGTKHPEKVVIVSGHIDSWDVGDGAMDDGGGVFISWGALALLKNLNLKPKRTIRSVFWTAEEFGYVGASGYAQQHQNETDNFVFLMESDIGTFNPVGLEYAGGATGYCIVQEIAKLLAPINATKTRQSSSVGSDIEIWTGNGIPGASLDTENDKYFWYHHTPADTLDAEDTAALDKNTALWASVAYVIADLSIDFPRDSLKTKN